MRYVTKEPAQISFNKAGVTGKIFATHALTEKTEFVLISTQDGHETQIIEHIFDFNYYILEGQGSFIIDGKEESCEKGDLVIVPAGKKFTYSGSLKMLLVCNPPWKESQEEEFYED